MAKDTKNNISNNTINILNENGQVDIHKLALALGATIAPSGTTYFDMKAQYAKQAYEKEKSLDNKDKPIDKK